MNNYKKEKKHILVLGGDLSTNTGIASVIKAHNFANNKAGKQYFFYLLRLSNYKDKNKFFKLLTFFRALFIWHIKIIFGRVDLIHIHSSGGIGFYRAAIFILLGKLFVQKTIVHIHASNFYEFFLPNNKIIKKVFRIILSINKKIIVLCNDWKQKLLNHYDFDEKYIVVLHNPVVLPEYELSTNVRYEKFKIIFIGFFIKSKGILDILEIAKRLKEDKIKDITIYIGGKGELENYIEKYIYDYMLDNELKVLGWINKNDVLKKLMEYDVFFLPSYKEGMPIAILEAMSVGLPILSTRISGIPELVKNGYNGFLLKPGDINGFYNKILWMKSHPEAIKKYKINGKKLVQNFSSDNIYRELLSIYQEVLKNNTLR